MNATGATAAITRRRDRLSAWIADHRRISLSTLVELLKNPLGSLMTWLVIGIALGLPAILYVVLQNVSNVSGDWGGKPRVSLYLSESVSVRDAQTLSQEISLQAGVEQVRFISADDALLEFQHRSGFGEVLRTLDKNPLPHVVEVMPTEKDPLNLSLLISSWEGDPRVERVSVDLQWLERLFAILLFAERLVTALTVVLCLGLMLIMGNTISLAIENRRQEIEVVKLVGGTDGFVRRPFLYLGFWYGLGGAIFACLLLEISLLFLSTPVELLAQSYRDDFVLQGPGWAGIFALIGLGSVLGVIGSVLAVSRHLAAIEPS